ncbi:MAG: arginine--tRNA ligase [candidate division WOR-3 bacterium]|jgi:arginyl-tRNA synthetase
MAIRLKSSFGEIDFVKPTDFKFADAVSNIAFKLSKELKKSPKEIADEIVKEIKNFDIFEKVENVNGFVNAFFSKEFLIDFIFRILNDNFIELEEKKNYIIEFVSANPTGPLNIVNARAGAIGDTLVRIGKYIGHNVISEYYVNDEGNQILSLGYSILWRLGFVFSFSSDKKYIEIKRIENLQEPNIIYIDNKIIQIDVYRGDYVISLSKRVENNVTEMLNSLNKHCENSEIALLNINELAYNVGKISCEVILSEQMEVLKNYGINYDVITKESFIRNSEYPKIILQKLKNYLYFQDLNGNNYDIEESEISRLLDKNYYLKNYKDKALLLKTTTFGDDKDRVLIRSNGEPTYFFWDIAYHYYKILRLKDGYIINLLGPDHYGYIPRLTSALKMLGFENLSVLIIQQTNLIKDGKKLDMSKRKGQIYEMKELIEEVGIDSARFFFLLRSPSAHLDFDIDLAKKLSSENPVYYVQYAHARIESIKEHSKAVNINFEFKKNYLENYDFKNERNLIVRALYFEDVIKKAFYNLEPHLIVYYLLELSEAFHSYYQHYRVIDIEDKHSTIARIIILEAIRKIINVGLSLIGVSAPKKM